MSQIKSLADLALAKDGKRSVTCPSSPCFKGPTPAAFVMNYTGEIILRLISTGLFIYQPTVKKSLHKKKPTA